jgi:hypothetical protein
LIDHPEAYAQVMKIITQHNAEFGDRMHGQTGITLRQAITLNPRPEELSAKIEAALATSGH